MSPLRALLPQGGMVAPFDYYVRSITTAILALSIVGVTLYAVITSSRPSELLIGWTGIVVGVYFGYHVSQNSRGIRQTNTSTTASEPIEADRP